LHKQNFKKMKSTINFSFILSGTLLLSMLSFSQVKPNHSVNKSKKEVKMGTLSQDSLQVSFIDKFFVPKNSIDEFKQKMNYNRNFVSNLLGYVKGDAFEQKDTEGNMTIITIAVWENQDKLNNAKNSIQTEFKRVNFNPSEFYQRLNIKVERGLYKKLHD
jgi:heme-degrading monooxygenase HmoA